MRANLRAGRFPHSANSNDEKPRVTLGLIKRVISFARPYRSLILGMLLITLVTTGLSLLTPLILRTLIDTTLPSKNVSMLVWLTIAMLAIPVVNGGLSVVLRQLNARVGEGVVFDLRSGLFSPLPRMSLSFFTHTKVGE